MLENEPNDREVNDGSGGPDHGAISAGTGRGRASSRPAGPPDPVGPATPPASSAPLAPPAPPVERAAPPAVPPTVSFQPPQVLFQPPPVAVSAPGQTTQPEAQAPAPDANAGDQGSRRAGTRRRSSGGRASKAADEGTRPADSGPPSSGAASGQTGDSGDSGPDEADDGTEETPGRRRRRRGGRSRARGRSGNGEDADGDGEAETDGGPEGRSGGDASAGDASAGDETADDDTDADGDDENGGAQGRRRRRKRRRGSSGDTERGGTEDDPPDTVVHVREPRAAASRPADDVRTIKGSTRLEAKRQRRREGRESGRRRPPVVTEAEFLARREAVERNMVVRQRGDRTQIAVLEDGVLVEHYVNRASHQSYVGNVYLGKVQNVLPSMEAAFVDIGKGRNAVLYAGEVNFDASGLEGHSKRIESALKSGQSILVQVTKDPVGHKGARLTSQVSLPGRYLVYVPGASMTGISRKLPENERTRLKTILKKVTPEHAGVIVRTAAEGAAETELDLDITRFFDHSETIEKK